MSDRRSLSKEDIEEVFTKCSDLSEAVGVAVGMASMCWENVEGAGEFMSRRAAWITEALYEHIQMNRSFAGSGD